MDTIYFNGKVRAMTSHLPEEAVLVRDGVILSVGEFAPLLKEYIYTQKVDLKGGTLLPLVPEGEGAVPRTVIELDCGPGESDAAPGQILGAVREAGEQGVQIAARCFTDTAIDRFLSALVSAGYPARLRPVILGGEMMEKDQLVRAKRLGVGVEFSVVEMLENSAALKKELGERAMLLCPCWSALKRGVPFTFSQTDETLLSAVFAASQRRTADGEILGRGERISIYEALRAATVGRAWCRHRDDCGDVAPGMEANFLIFDRDMLDADEDEEQARVHLTRIIHRNKAVWSRAEK